MYIVSERQKLIAAGVLVPIPQTTANPGRSISKNST